MRELHRIGVRPLDGDIHKNCVRDILDRLVNFDNDTITNSHPESAQICNSCSRSWKRVVEYTRRQVESYFDGLCLDCMQNTPDENSEYWALDTPGYVYDNTCRIRHGEPTWYFSFMGRGERNPYCLQSWMNKKENSRLHHGTHPLPWDFAKRFIPISLPINLVSSTSWVPQPCLWPARRSFNRRQISTMLGTLKPWTGEYMFEVLARYLPNR